MPNCASVCLSTTINPGDKIILRGGDTWHANLNTAVYMGGNWHFTTAGSSGSPIYIGVNKTWFTGTVWTQPVITGDNPVFNGTSFPASCTYDYGTPTQKFLIQISQYNTFDNIAYLGDCWSGSASGFPGQLYAPGNDTLTNLYCHGWTLTSTSSDAVPCIASQGSNNIIEYNVFDGSDAPNGAAGSAICTNSPAGVGCTTGIGIYDAGSVVAFNVFHQIRVGGVLVDSELVHDNTFEYMAPAPISSMGVQHDDAIMYYHGGTSASGVTEYLYNNVVRHNWINEQFYIPVSGGSTAYVFNNVFYDNHNAAVGNCIQLNAQSSGTQTLYLYNNTIDQDTDNSSGNTNGCTITFYGTTGGNSFGIPWTGPVYTANNHLIGLSAIASLFGSNSGATYTVNQNGGDLLQPTATARSQGYVQATNDAPVNSTGSTVGAGINASSLASTFSSDLALDMSTPLGPVLAAGYGGYFAQYPQIAMVARTGVHSGAWDSGAYKWLVIPAVLPCQTGYSCLTTSTSNPGLAPAPFAGTTGVNQTAYDPTYNQLGLGCYTRATDSTTFGGKSVGNNTYSGGDNDIMWSKNSDFVGTTEGGFIFILNLNVSGNCAQVLNTGNITGAGGISGPGPFGFSKVQDNLYWNLVNDTQIQSNVITIPYNKTVTQTVIADVANGTTCPGLPFPFTPTWSGILGIKNDDTRFAILLSNTGGQGTGVWSVVYDRTLGCAVENTSTGSYWAFCTSSCTPSTPATGTLSTTGNSCWGGAIHDGQFSGDGNSVVISENQGTAWTQGACAGVSTGTQFSIWTPGTATTAWCGTNTSGGGGLYCGGHDSVGTSKIITSESSSVAATRLLSNVTSYTQYATGPLWSAHGYWPQPDQADDYPYVQTAYGLLATGQDSGCGNPNLCPIAGGNAIFVDYPGNPSAYPPGQARTYAGHTFSCNTTADPTYATCPQGLGDFGFGGQYSIMSVSQDGQWAMMASGMLLGLGIDSTGNSRVDDFIVHLGSPLSTFPHVLTAVQPPTSPTQTNYTAYQAVLAQNSPLLPMQTVIAGAGNSQAAPIPLYIDSDTGTGACSVTPVFTTLDAVIAGFSGITSIIIAPVLEGGQNGSTSKCVWSQAWANASALTWAASTHYLPGEYICIGAACTNPTPSGKYWQIQTGCYPGTGYDNTCVSSGTIPSFPACITGCTPGTTTVADGAGPTAFNWVYEGSAAPLQDSACNFSYKCGSSTTNCWLANGSADIIINSGSLGACTLNELWQSLAIPSELPIRKWYNQIQTAVIAHYNGNPKVGYIRFGGVAGGELGPLKSSEWPWYGSSTGQNRAQFLSWVNEFDAGIMGNSPTVPIYSNFNVAGPGFTDPLYADQEAFLAWQYNFLGLDTNGAQLYDVLNLLGTGTQNCAFPLVLGTECTTSDWAPVFATYLTNSAGVPMHHILQSATGSTPLSCSNSGPNAVTEGPMGALPIGSTYCAAGYPGMLNLLATFCSTGIGSPAQKVCVDTYELYTNAFTGTSPTQEASDVLLALSKNYALTTNAQVAYLPQQSATVSSFCNFMGISCSVLTMTVVGTGGVTDSLSQINCPTAQCLATYITPTATVLTATPGVGQLFVGWSGGGCSGTSTCSLTVSSATAVTATFSSSTPTASTPTFLPIAGTYAGAQSVAISAATGPVICWNTTGSPATNGAAGCTAGTLYTGPVAVATSETLYAVAGGTGYLDSSIGSAAYVITPSVTGGFTITIGTTVTPGVNFQP
jgi:hypothetical protein